MILGPISLGFTGPITSNADAKLRFYRGYETIRIVAAMLTRITTTISMTSTWSGRLQGGPSVGVREVAGARTCRMRVAGSGIHG
jgi:hypothetical protein